MIDINDFWNYSIHNLNRRRSKDYFWLFFIFVDLWNLLYNWNKLLNIVRNFLYLINSCIDLNNLFFETFNFLYLPLDVIFWNLFEFNLVLDMNSFFNLRNDLRNILLDGFFYDSFNYLSDRLNFYCFSVNINWNCTFDIDRNWYLNWFEDNSINKLYFSFLYWNSDYFINMHCYRNLLFFNNNSFLNNLMNLNIGSCFKIFHQNLISRKLNSTIYC